MPENIWTNGAANGLWSDGDNWSLTTEPADGEDIVLNGTATASITGGFASDAAAPAVNSFFRHPEYTGHVGTSGDPLVLATAIEPDPVNPFDPQGKVIVQGPGEFYYVNGVGGAGQQTALLYVDTDEQSTAIEVDGAINRLQCIKGRVTALSNFDPGSVAVGYRTNPATDVHLTLRGSAEVGVLGQSGGTVINTGTAIFPFLNVSGGTFDHGLNGGSTRIITQTGGLIIHRSTATTIAAWILGGTLDMSADGRAKTVSLLQVFPGAEFKQNPHITITNGGSILPITDIIPQSF